MSALLTAFSQSHALGGQQALMGLFGSANIFARMLEWWETFSFTRVFFSPSIAIDTFPMVLQGFPITLALGFIGFALAIPFGLGLAFMKMSKIAPLRWISTFYIDVVRGTPLLLQILIIYMGLPLIPAFQTAMDPFSQVSFLGLGFSAWFRAFLILSANSAAYLAEIFRAGIQSIPKGQMEAARSLGMKTSMAMTYVVLPQTFRRIIPTCMSEFILLLKDTALFAMVAIGEVMLNARIESARVFNMTPLTVAACFYLIVTIPAGRLVARLENKLAEQDSGAAPSGRPGKRQPRLNVPSTHIVSHDENILQDPR
ncbi:MAG: amino acid ABC transporter permease [Coriobacteriia bacterium]|nr:amino acid ABC transporter permease [Coriobacteriia bacterium]MCL2537038.1 amino acid ABC transporter permease [Coriobacteriia bacterium]